jgi:hypothetical protein
MAALTNSRIDLCPINKQGPRRRDDEEDQGGVGESQGVKRDPGSLEDRPAGIKTRTRRRRRRKKTRRVRRPPRMRRGRKRWEAERG